MIDDALEAIIKYNQDFSNKRGLIRWFQKHVSDDRNHLRWCTFDGDAWHANYPCNCHPSYMVDFPDMPVVIAAWLLGGRAAIHAIERGLLASTFEDRAPGAGRKPRP